MDIEKEIATLQAEIAEIKDFLIDDLLPEITSITDELLFTHGLAGEDEVGQRVNAIRAKLISYKVNRSK